MKAEIIAVGSELLMGETQDTNSGWLATRMPELGLELQWVTAVGDDLAKLTEILDRAWRRSDFVFTIGGLGPTLDDLTRDAIARMLGEEIAVDSELVAWLEESFSRRGVNPMPPQNIRQAMVIPSAVPVRNEMGTAPSWWLERDGKVLVTLPGPPNELMHMWTTEIVSRLRKRITGSVIMARTFKTIGLSEATVDELCGRVYDMQGIDFGCYAKPDGIYVRTIARAQDEQAALSSLLRAEEEIRNVLGEYLWGVDDETPEARVGQLLRERGYTVAVLESLTGGLIGGALSEGSWRVSLLPGRRHRLLERGEGRGRSCRQRDSGVRRGVLRDSGGDGQRGVQHLWRRLRHRGDGRCRPRASAGRGCCARDGLHRRCPSGKRARGEVHFPGPSASRAG